MSGAAPLPWTTAELQARMGGRAVIECVLGQGGMGVVYRVRCDGEPRALKVLLPLATPSPDALRRFLLEGRILRTLDHPALLKVHEIGEDPKFPYLLCDLVDGAGLDRMLAERGAMPWATAFDLIGPLLDGLGVAHKAGIVHRDIKPSNILADREGRLKLADFGIAKAEGMDAQKTSTGIVMGTPAYMAPELILSKTPTPAADVYSMGSVLFEMLTGEAPFVGDDVSEILTAKLQGPVPLPTRRIENLPRALDRLLTMALARDPEERLPTASAFRSMLEDTRRTLAATAHSTRSTQAVSTRNFAVPSAGAAKVTRSVRVRSPGESADRTRGVAIASGLALAVVVGALGFRMARAPRAVAAVRASAGPSEAPLDEADSSLVSEILACQSGGVALKRRLEQVRAMPVERAVRILFEAWRGGVGDLRGELAMALGQHDHPHAVPALVEILSEPPGSSPHRIDAAARLLQLVGPGGLERGSCPGVDVQLQRLCALLKLARRPGRGERPEVARAAIACLAWFGSPRTDGDCVTAIREAPQWTAWSGMGESDPDRCIVEALRAIPTEAARAALPDFGPRSQNDLERSIAGQ